MSWYEKYMSIPFVEKGRDWNGCDCWGLVRLIYATELGIELPSYLETYENTNDSKSLRDVIVAERSEHWLNPTEPTEFDVILLQMRGVPMHVGVVTKKNHMIHCVKDIGIAHEHYGTARWKHRVMGFGRWEK